jgi:hypothetical protein
MRLLLIFLTGLGQALFFILPGTGVAVVMSAAFIVGMFVKNRKESIEHSVPYGMAYAWVLSSAVLGSSYLLGFFYDRFDTELSIAFVLVSQGTLTAFGVLVLTMLEQVTQKITIKLTG